MTTAEPRQYTMDLNNPKDARIYLKAMVRSEAIHLGDGITLELLQDQTVLRLARDVFLNPKLYPPEGLYQ